MMPDTKVFVNTQMETDLVEKLDTMVDAKGQTRAGLIRLLVKQAWERHISEEYDRTTKGLKLVDAKTRNGKKQIKTLKAEQS